MALNVDNMTNFCKEFYYNEHKRAVKVYDTELAMIHEFMLNSLLLNRAVQNNILTVFLQCENYAKCSHFILNLIKCTRQPTVSYDFLFYFLFFLNQYSFKLGLPEVRMFFVFFTITLLTTWPVRFQPFIPTNISLFHFIPG